MLRSLVRLKIINNKDLENFKSDLETVTSKFIFDCSLLSNDSISFSQFKKIYGHLRPGTYDINSKNYHTLKKDFFVKKRSIIEKKKHFILNKTKEAKVKNILKKNNLNLDATQFFLYSRKSIESREYSKFVFTKYVDLILKRISAIAKLKGLSKKQISFFTIKELTNLNFIKSSKKKLLNEIKKRQFDYKINLNIKLPLVLIDAKGVDVIPFQVSSPNFIGNKKIFSKIVFIDNNMDFKKGELNQKIILIENADPGFDWLFNFPINGLITKFGGANSHMSIRCNELKIPAAIGVGEKIFQDIRKNDQLILNCALKKIEVN